MSGMLLYKIQIYFILENLYRLKITFQLICYHTYHQDYVHLNKRLS